MSSYPQQTPQYPGYPAKPANPFADQAPVNPYAAPLVPQPMAMQPGKQSPFAGLWRQGNLLVMHKLAPLPDICLLSNEPATRRIKRKLQWHHPAIALTIFLGVLVYVVLALILTKRAVIQLPLTEEWAARRQRRMLYAWGVAVSCLVLFVLGIVMAVQTEEGSYLALSLLGFIGALVALVAGQSAVALVSPNRISDDYVWLKGVHADFLNRLEPWPYNV